jgi:hypothetical protein
MLVAGQKPGQVIMAIMSKEIQITIDSLDLGQIVDGLRSRQESWKNTAIYLRDGFFPDDAFLCEDCSDADEAERIANRYQRIIASIDQQIEQQGGC